MSKRVPKSPEAMRRTPLAEFYDALCGFSAQERTALAEAHADDPKNLLKRFLRSVEIVEQRPPIEESFYDSKRTAPSVPPTPCAKTTSTIAFASHLCDGTPQEVLGFPEFRFRYIDREIFPARTKGEARASRRSLDLLLVNDIDGTPIFGELKIDTDRDAYFAFVQALMHAAEFQSPSQRARLKAYPGGDAFAWANEGPYADIYIVAHKSPDSGRYRARSLEATERIAERLANGRSFSHYIRRAAYINALCEDEALVFEKRFAFGAGI